MLPQPLLFMFQGSCCVLLLELVWWRRLVAAFPAAAELEKGVAADGLLPTAAVMDEGLPAAGQLFAAAPRLEGAAGASQL